MRSSRISPLALSSSYFTLEPKGISMTQSNSLGSLSPGVTSCQGWIIGFYPDYFLIVSELKVSSRNPAPFSRVRDLPAHKPLQQGDPSLRLKSGSGQDDIGKSETAKLHHHLTWPRLDSALCGA